MIETKADSFAIDNAIIAREKQLKTVAAKLQGWDLSLVELPAIDYHQDTTYYQTEILKHSEGKKCINTLVLFCVKSDNRVSNVFENALRFFVQTYGNNLILVTTFEDLEGTEQTQEEQQKYAKDKGIQYCKSSRIKNKILAELQNGIDRVYEKGSNDYHNSDAIQLRMANLNGEGCFSGRSAVLLADGNLKSMKDLQIGDELLTANKSVIGKAKICSFLHYEPETIATFLQFRLKNGTVLEVTHEHMIAVYSRQNHQTAFLLAQNAAVGDCLVEYQNGIMALEEIVEIALIEEKGIYAPLTTSGTLIVNSCLASCYASFESQMLCHLAMLPLIIYTSVHKQEPTVGIHSYCRTLQQFLPLLSPGK